MNANDDIFRDQPWLVRAVRGFWGVNPFLVLGLTMMLGLVPLLTVLFAAGKIGDVAYYMPTKADAAGNPIACDDAAIAAGECVAKQVGYAYALNWWPALSVLLPVALFFAFASVQNMQATFRKLRERKMFSDYEWRAEGSEQVDRHLKRVVRQIWMVFAVAATIIGVLVGAVIVLDWLCVVHLPLEMMVPLASAPNTPLPDFFADVCSNKAAYENDWSVAATFSADGPARLAPGFSAPGETWNYIFSAYVYFLLLVETIIVLSYFAFVFALSLAIYNMQMRRSGIIIVPDLKSRDGKRRMGFENFEQVFAPCIYVVIASFIMAFLMRIQNEYLRDVEFQNIYLFIIQDISRAADSIVESLLPAIVEWEPGKMLDAVFAFGDTIISAIDVGAFADPNSKAASPAILIVFALVSVALGFVLRDSARHAKDYVVSALRDAERASLAERFYGMTRQQIADKVASIEIWPLSWPRLRQSVVLVIFGIICFIFFRLALIWIGFVIERAVRGKLFGQDSDDAPDLDDPAAPTPAPAPGGADDGPTRTAPE